MHEAHWPGFNLAKFRLNFEGLWTAFGGTFVDRMGAPERAQINIHDHWLRMLIGGRGIMGVVGGAAREWLCQTGMALLAGGFNFSVK